MSDQGWATFHRRWARLKPPLRANGQVVAALGHIIEGHDDLALVLGVTPELADIAADTVAMDWSETMIAHVWPGDTPRRRAVLGDWLRMPTPARRFSAVIGDGSLNVIAHAHYPALFGQLSGVLAPGARLAVRVYETPTPCESWAGLRQALLAGEVGGFHAFKWRLAMAIAGEGHCPDVPVAVIHRRFETEFPDRPGLARATGWSAEDIDEIDAYAGAETVLSFPTRAQILEALPAPFSNPRFFCSGDYDLAGRCPILVADFTP